MLNYSTGSSGQLTVPLSNDLVTLALSKMDVIHLASLIGQYERFHKYMVFGVEAAKDYVPDDAKQTVLQKFSRDIVSLDKSEALYMLSVFEHWDRVFGQAQQEGDRAESNLSLSQQFNIDYWKERIAQQGDNKKSLSKQLRDFIERSV